MKKRLFLVIEDVIIRESLSTDMVGSMGMSAHKAPVSAIPVGRVRSYREVICASGRYRRHQLLCIVALCHCGDSLRVKNNPYAKTAGAWRGWGQSLISVALVAFGLVNFQLIHTSPRPVVEGNLWDIREEFKNGLTRFMITDATGQAVMILCRHRGPGFVQGERARVRKIRAVAGYSRLNVRNSDDARFLARKTSFIKFPSSLATRLIISV
jgi:hypothetical protein